MQKLFTWASVALTFLSAALRLTAASPVASEFTYQGMLLNGGVPASGAYDFTFALFDSAAGGTRVSDQLTKPAVAVANGQFSAGLDFGNAPFSGASLWLEVGVRTNQGAEFVVLGPRQPVTSAPYAITAGKVTGPVDGAAIASGSITGAQLASNTITAGQLATGAAAANLQAGGLAGVAGTGLLFDGSVQLTNSSLGLTSAVALAGSGYHARNQTNYYVFGCPTNAANGYYQGATAISFPDGHVYFYTNDAGFTLVDDSDTDYGYTIRTVNPDWAYGISNSSGGWLFGATFVVGDIWPAKTNWFFTGDEAAATEMAWSQPTNYTPNITIVAASLTATGMVSAGAVSAGTVAATNLTLAGEPVTGSGLDVQNGLVRPNQYADLELLSHRPSGVRLPPMCFFTWTRNPGTQSETNFWGMVDLIKTNGMDRYGWTYILPDDLQTAPIGGTVYYSNGVPYSPKWPTGFAYTFNLVHANGLKMGWYFRPDIYPPDPDVFSWFRTNGVDYVHIDYDNEPPFAKSIQLASMLRSNWVNPPFIMENFDGRNWTNQSWDENIFKVCDAWTPLGQFPDQTDDLTGVYLAWKPIMAAARRIGVGSYPCGGWIGAPTNQYAAFGLGCLASASLLTAFFDNGIDPAWPGAPGCPVCCTNRELIAVNQDPMVGQPEELFDTNNLWCVWKPLADGSVAVGVWNHGTSPRAPVALPLTAFGLQSVAQVRDLFWLTNCGPASGTFTTAPLAGGQMMMYRMIPGGALVATLLDGRALTNLSGGNLVGLLTNDTTGNAATATAAAVAGSLAATAALTAAQVTNALGGAPTLTNSISGNAATATSAQSALVSGALAAGAVATNVTVYGDAFQTSALAVVPAGVVVSNASGSLQLAGGSVGAGVSADALPGVVSAAREIYTARFSAKYGGVPTVALAAGASPGCTVWLSDTNNSTDSRFQVTFANAAGGSGGVPLFTVTFSRPYAVTPYAFVTPRNFSAAATYGWWTSNTTASVTFWDGAVAPQGNTNLIFDFWVVE